MTTLSWNCRGLGNQETIRELHELVTSKRPNFIFLIETKIKKERVFKIRKELGFAGGFAVDPIGIGGGIALFWKIENNAQLLSFSNHHIDVEVKLDGCTGWRLTGFYGYSKTYQRRLGWNLLRTLENKSTLPWCVIGDFNDICFQSEKQSSTAHPTWLLTGFRQTLTDCQLYDLGFEGVKFTWNNGRTDLTRERLDRAVASNSWKSKFPMAKLHVLQTSESDHLPLFLFLGITIQKYVARRFRYENAWSLEMDCKKVVEDGWRVEQHADIEHRIFNCTQTIQQWAKHHQQEFRTQLNDAKRRMDWLQRQSALNSSELKKAQERYSILLLQKEMYWKQRSKQYWLAHGDANTKYFHATASNRRRKNMFQKLKNDDGNWVEWESGLPNLILDFYTKLFTSEGGDTEPVLRYVQKRVTVRQNEKLMTDFSAEEVREAIFSMHPDKAPGPDGLNPGFFQAYWEIVGEDVTKACLKCLNEGNSLPGKNVTNVVLIPKKKTPEVVADLRPISLSNVADRIVCKALANRLKSILADVVSDSQSAFIPNRLITDSIIVAYELFHTMKRKTQGLTGFLSLKTDMSKAYDRIEWGYLKQIMLGLGFCELWVEKIMRIVTSVSYIFVRGAEEYGPLFPHRGLRQGDPLSPYLFILCADDLSQMLSTMQAQGKIHGAQVCRNAPPISHIFFADDALFFTKATEGEAVHLKESLLAYEIASGQKINLSKSSVMFTPCTPQPKRDVCCHIFGVQAVDNHGSYLGMPSIIGKDKKQIFQFVVEKLTKRIQGWKAKILSKAGKDVLLRTVAQAMPNYIMSLFLLPIDVCKELEMVMNSFFWNNGKSSSIHWLRWKRMVVPQANGGLGYRDLRLFNLALLAKQGWRILRHPDSLMAKILKQRYFPDTDFFSAEVGGNPSQIWRSICASRSILMAGCRRRIGDGLSTRVREDPWLLDDNPYIQSVFLDDEIQLVADLIQGGRWNSQFILSNFQARDVELIQQIPLSMRQQSDMWYWNQNRLGVYKVKEGYRLAIDEADHQFYLNDDMWERIWKVKVPAKVNFFIWRVLRGCLPCNFNLRKRKVEVQDACIVCGLFQETELHLLHDCTHAQAVWVSSIIGWEPIHDLKIWFSNLIMTGTHTQKEELFMLSWSLWHSRNQLLWQQKHEDSLVVLHRARSTLQQWQNAQLKPKENVVALARNRQWIAPEIGKFKCNIDIAILTNSRFGLGFILRNHQGLCEAGKIEAIYGNADPTIGEALCFREALSWLKTLPYHHVTVETDCQVVTKALISQDNEVLSYFQSIIVDCKALLNELPNVSFRFVYRSANHVAHCCARAAGSMSGLSWGVCPPNFLYEALMMDFNNMR
ncbi:uncharacterized protein LOC122724008 [Manihot esculenta]|uniref:uncharacterized protein LOC122724008 n=1 Tax=Manihot esculenta TaxID=3983 RepID=UPI001CC7F3AA|nr:uncharacterized protein LOC122724008 [Manihot esculenta]